MANTMISTMLATTAALALAACGGGGGDGDGDGGSSGGVGNNPAEISFGTLKSYSDGSGVFSAADSEFNSVVASTSVAKIKQILSGSVDLNEVPGSYQEAGTLYSYSLTGTTADGLTVIIGTGGEDINLLGDEYVQVSVFQIGNDIGIGSSGSPVKGLPTGSYTYFGTASVMDSNTGADGTFTMTANFDNNTGSIAATIPSGINNPAMFFGSNNLSINQTNGNFTTSNALIGETGVTSEAASINGYFVGTNALGVHGVVFPNAANRPNYLGAFYGSR